MQTDIAIIDQAALEKLKGEVGFELRRILSYFREDGARSIAVIEAAIRTRDAARIVRPAHTLKGDSAQFGAALLRTLSEQIEHGARRCVETHEVPDELIELVAQLRPRVEQTLALLEAECTDINRRGVSPLPSRQPSGFGRKGVSPGRL